MPRKALNRTQQISFFHFPCSMAINVVGWVQNEVSMSVGAPGTNNEWIGLGIRRRAPQMSRDAMERAHTVAVAF